MTVSSIRVTLRRLELLMLLTPLSLAGACSRSAAETASKATAPEAAPIAAKLVAAREISVPRVLTLSGSLVGADQAQVAAGAAGKVLATYVERGSVVKKGTPLARLDARMLNAQAQEVTAQVESLRAQQAQAQLDCTRTQHMFDKGAIAKADFDRAQTQCATAKWSLAGAEARRVQLAESLRDTDIRAPFTGMVVQRSVSAGEYVRPDSPVATVVSTDSLRIELTVPEADLATVKMGQSIDMRIPATGGNTVYHGKLKYIGPSVRAQSRDGIVEAVLDNPAHELRPGMFVTAQIALGVQTVVGVPRTAIRKEGTQNHVFVASAGKLEDRLVQVGDAQAQDVPVVNGLKAGEQVVENATAELHDGVRVK